MLSPLKDLRPPNAGAEDHEPSEDAIRSTILTAQMRRDRAQLARSAAEIAALRERIAFLENLAPHRAYEQARRAYASLPLVLRENVRRLVGGIPGPTSETPKEPNTALAPRGRALVLDDHWPQPDRDSGSVDVLNLVRSLNHLGFATTLAADRDHHLLSPAREALEREGFRCLGPQDTPSIEVYLTREATRLDLVVLCRGFCGGRFLELTRQHALGARVVFDSIDLTFLREERRARLLGDADALANAASIREREREIILGSDATLVVSRAELDLLEAELPEALVAEMPLARPIAPPSNPFARRAGIGFIGGFAHAPNVDALRSFLTEVWPLLLCKEPGLEMTIVGADMPDELLDGVPGRVSALGHLPDVGPWFESLRLTVAPLRYGAGAKGKVASSLAAGVPCVATPVAAEGMSLSAASGVLIAENAADFASRVLEVHGDEALWDRLSAGALAHARAHLSTEAWRERLDALLRRIGL